MTSKKAGQKKNEEKRKKEKERKRSGKMINTEME